jgi:protein-S-isoprenylcysteine O-methyltransferase Ste14
MILQSLEIWIGRVGAVAGFGTLAAALWGMWRGARRPVGREEGIAHRFLRWPVLFVATGLYIGLGVLLWRPLPIRLGEPARLVALVLGSLLYFPALALYLWGLRTLGVMFSPSSGFGVRLYADQRLITQGPYDFVRHPMYLAVIITGLGGLMIYRTWAMAAFALSMLGLAVRARREERALAAEFPQEWEAYRRRVPAWIPRACPHKPQKGSPAQ